MSEINAGVLVSALSLSFTLLGTMIVWLFKLGRWQGKLDSKLDAIAGIKEDVCKLHDVVDDHENRIHTIEITCNLRNEGRI